MPCWYCTGQGITDDFEGDPVLASAYSDGWNENPTSWAGETVEVVPSGYTWLNQDGQPCSPGSGTGCEGIATNPIGYSTPSIFNDGVESTSTTVFTSGNIPGWQESAGLDYYVGTQSSGGYLNQLANAVRAGLNSPRVVAYAHDLVDDGRMLRNVGGATMLAAGTSAIASAAVLPPAVPAFMTVFAFGGYLSVEGLLLSELGSGLQSIQQGSLAPLGSSAIDAAEPELPEPPE
jgi:hypothetical protein